MEKSLEKETLDSKKLDNEKLDKSNSSLAHLHHHYHSPEEKKRQLNRIARLIGHLGHIKTMIEDDEDCSAVLIQISAVKAALNGLGKEIISEHISHCIVHALEDGDSKAIEDFQEAIQKYL